MSEDFDIDDDLMEENEKQKHPLLMLWQDNPVFKVIVIMVVIIILYFAYSTFFADDDTVVDMSRLGAPSTVTSVPGEGEVDPETRAAIEARNEQDAQRAAQTGTSALPTPIGSDDAKIDIPDIGDDGTDPLSVWRRQSESVNLTNNPNEGNASTDTTPAAPTFDGFQQPLTPVMPQVQPAPPQVQQVTNPELTTAFAEQMRVIISTKQPQPASHATSNYPSPYAKYVQDVQDQELAMMESELSSGSMSSPAMTGDDVSYEEMEDDDKVILPAGQVVYAQILNALNSDINSPVLAHILSGPFAGGRAIGAFQRDNEYLVLRFDKIIKDDVVYSADVYALDADTTLGGLRTGVNRHWVRRVILPAAAEFIAGVGEAIAETNETTVVTDGGNAVTDEEELDTQEELAKGVERAADKVSEIFEEDEDIEITVTLDKGTPIGMMFVESVTEGDRQ